MAERKGFFGALFDLSFSSFVTVRLVKVLYVLTLILIGLAYIGIAIALFAGGDEEAVSIGADGSLQTEESGGNVLLGVLWLLIFGPLMIFFYTLLYRVFFELIVVVFRIYENTRDQLALARGGGDPAGPPPPA